MTFSSRCDAARRVLEEQLSRNFDGVSAIKYFGLCCTFMLAYRVSRDAIGDVEVKVVFWVDPGSRRTKRRPRFSGPQLLPCIMRAVGWASFQCFCRAALTLQNGRML